MLNALTLFCTLTGLVLLTVNIGVGLTLLAGGAVCIGADRLLR